MVGTTTVLARLPVIKFRKGGLGKPTAAPAAAKPSVTVAASPTAASPTAAAPAVATASAAPTASQQPMQVEDSACKGSSHFISSKQLPRRLRRAPLTDDEIASINEGGAAAATSAAESSNRAAAVAAEVESAAKSVTSP